MDRKLRGDETEYADLLRLGVSVAGIILCWACHNKVLANGEAYTQIYCHGSGGYRCEQGCALSAGTREGCVPVLSPNCCWWAVCTWYSPCVKSVSKFVPVTWGHQSHHSRNSGKTWFKLTVTTLCPNTATFWNSGKLVLQTYGLKAEAHNLIPNHGHVFLRF